MAIAPQCRARAAAMSFSGRLVQAWYRPALTPLTALLVPLSFLFGAAAGARRARLRGAAPGPGRVRVPVVVVGNVTVGGAGKTPLVRALALALRERGWQPGIVSRGYGGSARNARMVAQDDDAGVVGDEPLLLAAGGQPVAIGRDRVAAARCLLAARPEVDAILSDDGLQHYALERDVEIAVVDGARGLGNGWLLPAGPLREPAARLREVAAVVVTADAHRRAGNAPVGGSVATAAQLHGFQVPCFDMELVPEPWRRVDGGVPVPDPGALPRGSIHAIAGIAHPARFFELLATLGIAAEPHPFPDHHRYTAADLNFPGARAILMTEKDAVKCGGLADPRMVWLPVRAMLDPALVTLIEERMHGSQAA